MRCNLHSISKASLAPMAEYRIGPPTWFSAYRRTGLAGDSHGMSRPALALGDVPLQHHLHVGRRWLRASPDSVALLPDCGSSFQLNGGAIAAVVLVDLLLTLLLALAVYYMASCIHRRKAANGGEERVVARAPGSALGCSLLRNCNACLCGSERDWTPGPLRPVFAHT